MLSGYQRGPSRKINKSQRRAIGAAGVLRERALGKEKLFVHPKLVRLLTRDGNAFERYRKRAGLP